MPENAVLPLCGVSGSGIAVRRFTLMSRDFSAEHGEITPTLKLRRQAVIAKFSTVIDSMYLAGDHGIHDAGFCNV